MTPTPQNIVKDVARKCGDDVSAAIYRNMALVRGIQQKQHVAAMGAAASMGICAGAVLAVADMFSAEKAEPEDAADAVWLLLRPMVLRSIEHLRATQAGAA